MPTQTGSSQASRRTTQTRRYWKRLDRPVRSWWPWGLLPLLTLLGLFAWGALVTAPDIESATQLAVTEQLTALDGNAIKTEADGQHVSVLVAANGSSAKVKALAQSAMCGTWVGNLTCPVHVEIKRRPVTTEVSVAAADSAPTTTAPPPEPVARPETARFHDFRWRKTVDGVVLTGEVSDEATRDQLAIVADELVGGSVDNQLRVSGEQATRQYAVASATGLDIISLLERGEVIWQAGQLSARGVVSADQETLVRRTFDGALEANRLGELQLDVLNSIDRCNEQFSLALAASTINFRTASADIDTGSDALLEQLAGLAKVCPGSLQIEGHTDSVGDESMNLNLSQARAESVRSALIGYGIGATRLNAVGFGETKPVADNSTAAGRAENRRIVIRAVQ